jgi:hypothetical protein
VDSAFASNLKLEYLGKAVKNIHLNKTKNQNDLGLDDHLGVFPVSKKIAAQTL